MSRKNLGQHNVSDTGNWNVALSYAEKKIMEPLIICEEYQQLAKFGTSNIYEQLALNVPQDEVKMKAFERLVDTLIAVIDNTEFAVRKKGSKELLKTYRTELQLIEKNLTSLYEVLQNQVKKTRTISVNKRYKIVLARVIRIKALINDPLNQDDLIFTFKQAFDPREFKEAIKERMINRG